MAIVNNTSSRLVIEIGGRMHEVSGLARSVEIERPEGRELPTCTIVVYNMTPANVRQLRSDAGRVFVYVTVENVEHTAFVGNVASVVAGYDGADLRTEIMVTDSRASMASDVRLSYRSGARLDTVIRELCGQAGLTVGTVGADVAAVTFDSAYAYSGTARRALDQLTRRSGVLWRVDGGVVSVGTRDELAKRTGLRYAAGNGLIGSPQVLDGGKVGLDVALSPSITNGSIVRVQSAFVDAWCRVESHAHSFGMLGDVWRTRLTVKEVG